MDDHPHGYDIVGFKIYHFHDDDPRCKLHLRVNDGVMPDHQELVFDMPITLIAALNEDLAATLSDLLGNCDHHTEEGNQ